jgi:hypothetical protein
MRLNLVFATLLAAAPLAAQQRVVAESDLNVHRGQSGSSQIRERFAPLRATNPA